MLKFPNNILDILKHCP